jgi:hypothetical protein
MEAGRIDSGGDCGTSGARHGRRRRPTTTQDDAVDRPGHQHTPARNVRFSRRFKLRAPLVIAVRSRSETTASTPVAAIAGPAELDTGAADDRQPPKMMRWTDPVTNILWEILTPSRRSLPAMYDSQDGSSSAPRSSSRYGRGQRQRRCSPRRHSFPPVSMPNCGRSDPEAILRRRLAMRRRAG